nr:histidine kinase [Streptomyces sp. SID5785]
MFGRRARRRWLHLIIGGALAMPYLLLASVVVGPLTGAQDVFSDVGLQLASFACGLPLAALTAVLSPLTRPMSVAVARTLCGVDAAALADGPPRTREARARTAAWFTLHLGAGGIVSGMTLALPPFAGALIVLPFVSAVRDADRFVPQLQGKAWAMALCPVAGVVLLLALAACAAAVSGLLARWAPALLGPGPADRLAQAEARAADLAVRNRLARELHDSVGHALSAVTLQASAARRVLDSDPGFVREALAAIEDTTRRTVGELDAVLGVLREAGDGAATAPAPTLADDLDGLLRRTRAGGAAVTVHTDPGTDPAGLPPMVSREAYRIVQEALANALRHAGTGVELWLAREEGALRITAENALPAAARAARPGGGHGLRGIADRARLLGGGASAGPVPGDAGTWRLDVRLPLTAPPEGPEIP